jgi:hypothetical protein
MLTELAIVAATLLGPVLAVQAQKFLERRRVKKDRQTEIFRTLMTTRASGLSSRFVEALNAVPLEFYGSDKQLKKINDSWKLYLDHHSNVPTQEGHENAMWGQKTIELLHEMLILMAEYLDYDFSKAQLTSDIYSPIGHGVAENQQEIIRQGLARLFQGEFSLPMKVTSFPETAQMHSTSQSDE